MVDDYERERHEALLERLKTVERENARLRSQLEGIQSVTASLQRKVADLQSAFRTEVESTTHFIQDINGALGEVYGYLFPLVGKFFPTKLLTKSRLYEMFGLNRPPSSVK